MQLFQPKRVLFEEAALDYPMGKRLYQQFRGRVETRVIKSHNRVAGLPGKSPREAYSEAKKTLVVGVRRTMRFETSKPSADYALPLITGCPGHCQYCYLQTTLGKRPTVRVYANTAEILDQAQRYIDERAPQITTFEGACTSDPLAVEHLTGSLAAAIRFFGQTELGRFRFVTKYSNVDPLVGLDHRRHTRFRVSLNPPSVIARFEPATAPFEQRIQAAVRMAAAGYPIGFIVAPIFTEGDWRSEYRLMLEQMHQALDAAQVNLAASDAAFELITHRFTPKAKALILERYPKSALPMDEAQRRWKFGQFGYGKYVYHTEVMGEVKEFFSTALAELFPAARADYLV